MNNAIYRIPEKEFYCSCSLHWRFIALLRMHSLSRSIFILLFKKHVSPRTNDGTKLWTIFALPYLLAFCQTMGTRNFCPGTAYCLTFPGGTIIRDPFSSCPHLRMVRGWDEGCRKVSEGKVLCSDCTFRKTTHRSKAQTRCLWARENKRPERFLLLISLLANSAVRCNSGDPRGSEKIFGSLVE